jgi:hypothetical protein
MHQLTPQPKRHEIGAFRVDGDHSSDLGFKASYIVSRVTAASANCKQKGTRGTVCAHRLQVECQKVSFWHLPDEPVEASKVNS